MHATTKNPEKLSKVLTKKLNVQKTRVIGDKLELTVHDGAELLPRVVETAEENKMKVEAVVLREPSLEDVFLHYTGRAIRPEESNERHGEAAIRRRSIRND